jgi:hypothetical protein
MPETVFDEIKKLYRKYVQLLPVVLMLMFTIGMNKENEL